MIEVPAYNEIVAMLQASRLVLIRFRHAQNPEKEGPAFLKKIQQSIAVLKFLQDGQEKFSDPDAPVGFIDLDHRKMFEIARTWMTNNALNVAWARDVLKKMLEEDDRENLLTYEIECAIYTLHEIEDLYAISG